MPHARQHTTWTMCYGVLTPWRPATDSRLRPLPDRPMKKPGLIARFFFYRRNAVLPFHVVVCCFRLFHAQDFMETQTTSSERLIPSVSGRIVHSRHRWCPFRGTTSRTARGRGNVLANRDIQWPCRHAEQIYNALRRIAVEMIGGMGESCSPNHNRPGLFFLFCRCQAPGQSPEPSRTLGFEIVSAGSINDGQRPRSAGLCQCNKALSTAQPCHVSTRRIAASYI